MTASRQSSLAVQGLGFLESLWSRGEEGLLLSGVLPATLIIVGAVALPGWKPCPWSLNSPVLLKREKHVTECRREGGRGANRITLRSRQPGPPVTDLSPHSPDPAGLLDQAI